jgi:sortase A
MKFNKIKAIKTVVFVIMPLFFVVIGYFLLYFIFSDTIDMYSSGIKMVLSPYIPDFSDDLTTIFAESEEKNKEANIQETAENNDKDSDKDKNDLIQTDILQSQIEMPKFGTYYAMLSFDSIGTDLPLYFGDSKQILKKGAGQYIGSFIPGYNRPILIAGHNNTYFNTLKELQISDIVTITTNYGIYKYKIYDTKVTDADDDSAYDLSLKKEQLILYTCYPFDIVGFTDQRYFVYAEKISGPEIIFN